jgi:uncharacterized protein
MSRAASLLHLQSLDSELDRHRARLVAIAAAMGDDPALKAAQQDLEAARKQVYVARLDSQRLEHESQTLNDKISEVSQRMYGGGVTNPKELQDLAMDLESLQRRRAALEEQQFEALMTAEAAEARELSLRRQVAEAEAAMSASHGLLSHERQNLLSEISRLDLSRDAARASLAPGDLEVYDRLRQAKKGRAVVKLEDGTCTGCGVAPSSSRIQTARRNDELILCGNCGRILSAD